MTTAAELARERVIDRRTREGRRESEEQAGKDAVMTRLQALLDDGYHLLKPSIRSEPFLSLRPKAVWLNQAAKRAYPMPTAGFFVVKGGTLVIVPCAPETPGAYALSQKSSIGGEGLRAQIRAAGWGDGRYRVTIKAGMLCVRQADRIDDGAAR